MQQTPQSNFQIHSPEVIVISSDEEMDENCSTFVPDVTSDQWLPDLVKCEENPQPTVSTQTTGNYFSYPVTEVNITHNVL